MKAEERTSPKGRGKWSLAFLAASLLLAAGGLLAVTSSSREHRKIASGEDRLPAAKLAYVDRNYAEAETVLRELLRAEPDRTAAKILLGRVLLERGRLAESRDLFAAVLKAEPRHLEATRGQAATYRGMGQHDLAILYFTRATELDPRNPEVWKELGLCQREKGDPLGALSSLQQSLSLDGRQSDLTSLLSELAIGKPGQVASPTGLSRASAVDPFNPRPIDPESLVPRPKVPDPTRHFPAPGGRNR